MFLPFVAIAVAGFIEDSLVEPLIDSPLRTIGSDLNGDGIHDIVIGTDLTTAAGNVYVFFGSSSLSGTRNLASSSSADVTLVGVTSNDGFGKSVATTDINADGIDDIIVGAYKSDAFTTDAGAVYVYYGFLTISGIASPDITIRGASVSDYFGRSVSGAGDANGDGFDDIIVGSPYHDGSAGNGGAAFRAGDTP